MADLSKSWKDPVVGFEFDPDTIVVTAEHQAEKLDHCRLDHTTYRGFVDPSFYIGIGIHAGINSGISAEGNVNMLQTLIQHRPVRLGEPLTVRGCIEKVTEVPRGLTIDTNVWFEGEDGKPAISAPRQSLKPDPRKKGNAGDRPPAVIDNSFELERLNNHQLTPDEVIAYSHVGNSIHYDMDSANRAGFRAPIIGGGMGVHYLLNALWRKYNPKSFNLSIYFRRPIFWDDAFTVAAHTSSNPWSAIGLLKSEKVLTEARIENLVAGVQNL